MKRAGIFLALGISFSSVFFAPISSEAAQSDPLLEALNRGVSETEFLFMLPAYGWTAESNDGKVYRGSEESKDVKTFEEFMSYTTENGHIKQISITLKNGDKGVAESRFKKISSEFSKTLGRWTCDGLIAGSNMIAAKYNLWFLPKANTVVKVIWKRDPKHPFLTSDVTESVTYMMMKY